MIIILLYRIYTIVYIYIYGTSRKKKTRHIIIRKTIRIDEYSNIPLVLQLFYLKILYYIYMVVMIVVVVVVVININYILLLSYYISIR